MVTGSGGCFTTTGCTVHGSAHTHPPPLQGKLGTTYLHNLLQTNLKMILEDLNLDYQYAQRTVMRRRRRHTSLDGGLLDWDLLADHLGRCE